VTAVFFASSIERTGVFAAVTNSTLVCASIVPIQTNSLASYRTWAGCVSWLRTTGDSVSPMTEPSVLALAAM